MEKIYYDDIQLPEKVSNILEHDFWTLQHVTPAMVRTIVNPVKFSAFTSIFLTRGSADVEINLIEYHIEAPCMINVNAGGIMFPHNISDDFEASFAVFSQRMGDSIIAILKDTALFSIVRNYPVIKLSDSDRDVMQGFYDQAAQITSDPSIEYPYETMLHTIMAFFFRSASKYYEQFRKRLAPTVQNRIADRFIRLVQEHFRKERFLDFYAARLDITPKHLSRTIKLQTGASAVDWINRFVILEAKVMLRSSNLNVQQIAEELNFPSQSFFGKYFKKATGVSPKDYRNSFL